MTIYKTAELDGARLDLAVYKALGYEILATSKKGGRAGIVLCDQGYVARVTLMPDSSSPIEGWKMAGPLIDQYGISVQKLDHGWRANFATENAIEYWEGWCPLVAIMRCFVAKKLGNEVDLPC